MKYYGAIHNIDNKSLKNMSEKEPNYEIIKEMSDHGSIELFKNKKEARKRLTELRSEIKEFLEPFREEIQYRYSLTLSEFVSDRVSFIIKEYTIQGVDEDSVLSSVVDHLNTRRQKIEEELESKDLAIDFSFDISKFLTDPLRFENNKVYGNY